MRGAVSFGACLLCDDQGYPILNQIRCVEAGVSRNEGSPPGSPHPARERCRADWLPRLTTLIP